MLQVWIQHFRHNRYPELEAPESLALGRVCTKVLKMLGWVEPNVFGINRERTPETAWQIRLARLDFSRRIRGGNAFVDISNGAKVTGHFSSPMGFAMLKTRTFFPALESRAKAIKDNGPKIFQSGVFRVSEFTWVTGFCRLGPGRKLRHLSRWLSHWLLC